MGTPWELIRPDRPESDAQDSDEASSGTTINGSSSKGIGKEVDVVDTVIANGNDHHAQALEVEDEADTAARKAKDAMAREQGKKRWFREMCEMSGEMSALLEEAKKSFDAKRLVDVDDE